MATGGVALVAAALAAVVVTRLWTVMVHLVWRPYAVARAFARHGVRGPPYRVFVGNSKEVQAMRAATSGVTLDHTSHDYIPRVMPQYHAWVSLYGKVFLTWSGSTPQLFMAVDKHGQVGLRQMGRSDRAGDADAVQTAGTNPGYEEYRPLENITDNISSYPQKPQTVITKVATGAPEVSVIVFL